MLGFKTKPLEIFPRNNTCLENQVRKFQSIYKTNENQSTKEKHQKTSNLNEKSENEKNQGATPPRNQL